MSCSICMEPYDHSKRLPTMVPCGHTFCRLCLHRIFDSDEHKTKSYIPCPTCRKHVQRPNDMQDLIANFELLAMIDDVPKPKLMCSGHSNKPSTFICITCRCAICNSCSRHIKHKEHDVVALEDAEEELHNVSSQLTTLKTNVLKAQQRDESHLATYIEKLIDDINRRTRDIIAAAQQWQAEMLSELNKRQDIYKGNYDRYCSNELPNLEIGQKIRFRDPKDNWEDDRVVEKRETPRSYKVETLERHKFKRNRRPIIVAKDNEQTTVVEEPAIQSQSVEQSR